MFVLLPETSAIYPAWEALVARHAVSGKPAHDARLVAAMQVHGLTAILTLTKRASRVFLVSRSSSFRGGPRHWGKVALTPE